MARQKTAGPRTRLGRSNEGFSLIEVLFSLLVMLVGVLGLVRIQILSAAVNNDALARSQAVSMAAAVLEIVRASRGEMPKNTVADNEALLSTGSGSSNGPDCGTRSACFPVSYMEYDLSQFMRNFGDQIRPIAGEFRAMLPVGQISISSQGMMYTVQVSWASRRFTGQTGGDSSPSITSGRDSVVLHAVIAS